jgi:NADH-quinone oxidoreductase subunit M
VLNVLLWLPLAAGFAACVFPAKKAGWISAAGALGTMGLAIWLVADFHTGGGLQHTVDESWIPALGVRYSLGVDGLNLFLILLTALLWFAATAFSAVRGVDRARTYFLMLALGETATLGAFMAQDLLLFVIFFDLLLVPFYFLIGGWGTPVEPDADGRGGVDPVKATLKMLIYTLVGSLLMLVGAVATGILTANGGPLDFSLAHLAANPLGNGSQEWIFWFFAAAFLVKMPAFPLHGWMPDAYRAAPLPVLAVFSGVVAKVGAYGFIRIVLPLFPEAVARFQMVILIVALVSILYGSIMAFTQWNVRLVAGYSSVAQLGFITLGIFSLRPEGADGALLQMVNHGLVVAPIFLIVAVIAERAGTEDMRKLGGFALKAPVLAVMFLIVTLGTLAMPGSANFVGELYILFGILQSKIAIGLVASLGVVMAAYYALRLYQGTMHNRLPDSVESREIGWREGAILGGLVACIVALALYPQLILKRTDSSVSQTSTSSAASSAARPGAAAEDANGVALIVDRERP